MTDSINTGVLHSVAYLLDGARLAASGMVRGIVLNAAALDVSAMPVFNC